MLETIKHLPSNPEAKNVTTKTKKNNFAISELAKICHDTDILKDAKRLDTISGAFECNKSSHRGQLHL